MILVLNIKNSHGDHLTAETPIHEMPIQVAQFAFSSLDQLAETFDEWNLDWRQLDSGRLDAKLLQVASENAAFERVAFNRRFAQRGASPSGKLTFGLIEKDVGEIFWCHRTVSTDDLLVFSPEGDNDCVSKPGFQGHILSFSEEYLEMTAEDLELSVNLGLYREGGVALRIDADEAEDLRYRLRRLDRAVTSCTKDAEMNRIRHELEREIPALLLRLLAADPPAASPRIVGFRARLVQRARDYIDAHAGEPPTSESICRAAEESWRSLNYGFRDLFGVTPKQYLQATRLDGVRNELYRRGSAAKITDVANRWGFWHMGQFAADYKRQFGELPSETRSRTQPSTQ